MSQIGRGTSRVKGVGTSQASTQRNPRCDWAAQSVVSDRTMYKLTSVMYRLHLEVNLGMAGMSLAIGAGLPGHLLAAGTCLIRCMMIEN